MTTVRFYMSLETFLVLFDPFWSAGGESAGDSMFTKSNLFDWSGDNSDF